MPIDPEFIIMSLGCGGIIACPDNHSLLFVLAKEAAKRADQNAVEYSSSKRFTFNCTKRGNMIGLPSINPH